MKILKYFCNILYLSSINNSHIFSYTDSQFVVTQPDNLTVKAICRQDTEDVEWSSNSCDMEDDQVTGTLNNNVTIGKISSTLIVFQRTTINKIINKVGSVHMCTEHSVHVQKI